MSHSVAHAAFVVEKTYPAAPEAVFAAFADAKAKCRWFAGGSDWEDLEYSLDFRVGGREHNAARQPGGPAHVYDATFIDIVENVRIVSAYEMHLDAERISVSLATTEFRRDGAGTRLVYTEQGAFLDGFDRPDLREAGTRWLFDQLGKALADNIHPAA